MKTVQTATSLNDFEQMLAKVTNMVDAQYVILCAASFTGNTSSEWKREFCEKHCIRFSASNIYKILMGTITGNKAAYHFTPNPF